MGPDFPLGECLACVAIYLAQQPKTYIVQPARVLVRGSGYCREHLPLQDRYDARPKLS